MGRERKHAGEGEGRGGKGNVLRLLSPPPLPFYFALVPISARSNNEERHGNACYAGYYHRKSNDTAEMVLPVGCFFEWFEDKFVN